MIHVTMDFVKLDFFETLELYSIMSDAAGRNNPEFEPLKGEALVRALENLQSLPMTKKEASNLLPFINDYYSDLSDAFDDDWDDEEFKLRETTVKTILSEVERISKL